MLWMTIFAVLMIAVARTSKGEVISYSVMAAGIEQKYDLPPTLLGKICSVESRYQNVKGQHGEIGICQLKPNTVRHAFGSESVLLPHFPYLAYGSRNGHVQILQNSLSIRGYTVPRSGVFDRPTQIAVIHYQGLVKLIPDGIVGPRTWGALLGAPTIEEQLWKPRTNMEYAAKYLKWLSKVLDTNNPYILAAAYNGGPGNPIVRYMILVDTREVNP